MVNSLVKFIQDQYQIDGIIPLHSPFFGGNEKLYIEDTIDSSFVSSIGEYVNRFETNMSSYTGSPSAVATVNGTSALHIALIIAGVKAGDLVITQALTFVATCNAIAYCGAEPIFVDVDRATLGLSPHSLGAWLEEFALLGDDGVCRLKGNLRVIRACVPMHTFGHPVDLDAVLEVCDRWHLTLVEDAAESLGSFYKGRHTGTIGLLGALSFNGNKIITTGGGGMVLTSENLSLRTKHITTTAKRPHPFEYFHDELGFNYRLPNLNAALGCAQLEQLEEFLRAKRDLAMGYAEFFKGTDFNFVNEPPNCRSNYWLNAVICNNRKERDLVINMTNDQGVMTRPAWVLMSQLPMYAKCISADLVNSRWLYDRLVNLPSGISGIKK